MYIMRKNTYTYTYIYIYRERERERTFYNKKNTTTTMT